MHSQTLPFKAASLITLFGLCAVAPLAQAQSVVSLRLEGLLGTPNPSNYSNPGFVWDISSLPAPGVPVDTVPFAMTLHFEINDSGLSSTSNGGGSAFLFPFKGMEFSAGDFSAEVTELAPSQFGANILPLASLGTSVQPLVPLTSNLILGTEPATTSFSPLPADPFGDGINLAAFTTSFFKFVPNPGVVSTDREFLDLYTQSLTAESFDPLTATTGDFSEVKRITGLFNYLSATTFESASYGFTGVVTNAHVIPEPSVTALMFGGLAALVVVARRRFR